MSEPLLQGAERVVAAGPTYAHVQGGWVYFMFYIILVGFIYANLVTGVIVDSISRAEDMLTGSDGWGRGCGTGCVSRGWAGSDSTRGSAC